MVRRQLIARGIKSSRVLAAMASVRREHFVPQEAQHLAYADQPLTIECDQTISQPYIVALMTQEAHLDRTSRVLEVGTGSGYHTAVLAKIAQHVWSVERFVRLSRVAHQKLAEIGVTNATLVVGDGASGHAANAPYDAIVVTAAAPRIPKPLLDQLAVGGFLVIPIGDRSIQELRAVERTKHSYREHSAGSCRFVPLVSPHAFKS